MDLEPVFCMILATRRLLGGDVGHLRLLRRRRLPVASPRLSGLTSRSPAASQLRSERGSQAPSSPTIQRVALALVQSPPSGGGSTRRARQPFLQLGFQDPCS